MPEQLDLGALARRTDPETSQAAARRVDPAVGSVNDRILRALHDAGERGLTTKELEVATGIPRVTISPRMKPLEGVGLVAKVREKREGGSVYLSTGGTR